MATKTQQNAKKNKKDEFYTRLEDIESELSNYRHHFEGKTIFCNCDDPEWSNFWVYFHIRFSDLGLKKLISTHYNYDAQPSYRMEYEGGNDLDVHCWTQYSLKGNGDFRSEECEKILDTPNLIVVTNPPFSLYREYIALLEKHNCKYVVISRTESITYKEIFSLIKANKIWAGYNFNKTFPFAVGEGYKYDKKLSEKIGDGRKYGKVPSICWFTNLDIEKRHENFFKSEEAHHYYEGNESKYPKYVNFDAIEIGHYKGKEKWEGSVELIPIDYTGYMGVPVTFLEKFNKDEFELIGLGISSSGKEFGVRNYQPEHKEYRRNVQKKGAVDGDLYMLDKEGHPLVPYARIIIKNKNPISKEDDLYENN